MRLAGADLADDQKPFVAARVALFREIGGDEMSLRQGRMRAGKVGVVVRELAMLVAARDTGCTSKESARARNWQSQRVTRRSLMLRTAIGACQIAVFQPVPSQSGQIYRGLDHASSLFFDCVNEL